VPVGSVEFRVLRVPTATRDLFAGWNPVTYTGGTGTPLAELAGRVGAALESIWRYDAATARWDVYVVGAPGFVNTLTTLEHRDAIFLRLRSGQTVTWEDRGLIAAPFGERRVMVNPGWTLVP